MCKRISIMVIFFMFIATATAFAQQAGRSDYPKRPINILIGFAPGGGSDVMLSMVRPLLERTLKTTLVPVYKPGSGSDIALTEAPMPNPMAIRRSFPARPRFQSIPSYGRPNIKFLTWSLWRMW